MRPGIDKHKLARNIIVLQGKRGDVVVGNGDDFRFLHFERGRAFLKALDTAVRQGKLSVDRRLLELLSTHRIVVAGKSAVKKPPNGTSLCSGTMVEQTLILPLAERVDEEVYEKALSYGLDIVEDNSALMIGFHGADPVSSWPSVRGIAEVARSKAAKSRPDIRLKYRFDSVLSELPDEMPRWIGQRDVTFRIFSLAPAGLDGITSRPDYASFRDNIESLCRAGAKVSLVTPASRDNVRELLQIAEHYARWNGTFTFEFPALHNPSHPWPYGDASDLPDADEYLEALTGVYRAKHVARDLLVPVNELRHRIVNGGYTAACSCMYDHVTAIDADGGVYPCAPALAIGAMRIGSVREDPERDLDSARQKFDQFRRTLWVKCNKCRWRALCGMHCPLIGKGNGAEPAGYDQRQIDSYLCKPRLSLVRGIIWDMVGNVRRRRAGSATPPAARASDRTLLIMLGSDSSSLCHEFSLPESMPRTRLSPRSLTDILLQPAGDGGPKLPVPFFIAGDAEPLDVSIASILEGVSDHVVLPLMPRERQRFLRIVFSPQQTVIADSLEALVEYKRCIAARPVVLHIARTEIAPLAERLFSISRFIGKLTFRLRDIHLLEQEDITTYRLQLEALSGIEPARETAGAGRLLDVTNLDSSALMSGRLSRCPAGSKFLLIGPDGLVYPCQAFYRAGKKHSLGSLKDVEKNRVTLAWDQQTCGICGSRTCLGCPFLESEKLGGREKACKVYEAERLVRDQVARRIADSRQRRAAD